VLKQGLAARDLTDAMRHTPRDRLYERALRGRWHLFPSSPAPYYERLANGLGQGYQSKSATFRLAGRIEAARERLDRTTANDPAARLAARRALLAWSYLAMARCDDSYGVIGELARDALLTYAKLPFQPSGIVDEDWCEDLCELLAWEDWGLLHRHETKPFAQIRGPLADHAESFLVTLADELRTHRLPYQADQALQHVAYLHVAAGRVTRFAQAAATLGSHHWMPIVALAEAAIGPTSPATCSRPRTIPASSATTSASAASNSPAPHQPDSDHPPRANTVFRSGPVSHSDATPPAACTAPTNTSRPAWSERRAEYRPRRSRHSSRLTHTTGPPLPNRDQRTAVRRAAPPAAARVPKEQSRRL
jgi:hypothetical protein